MSSSSPSLETQVARKIAVALDFTRPSNHALDAAILFAQQFGSTLELVHVLGADVVSEEVAAPDDVGVRLNQFVQYCRQRGVSARAHLLPEASEVHRSILALAANQRVDLIVLGTHGRSGLRRAVLGSIAEQVIRHASIPVLALPKGKHPY